MSHPDDPVRESGNPVYFTSTSGVSVERTNVAVFPPLGRWGLGGERGQLWPYYGQASPPLYNLDTGVHTADTSGRVRIRPMQP